MATNTLNISAANPGFTVAPGQGVQSAVPTQSQKFLDSLKATLNAIPGGGGKGRRRRRHEAGRAFQAAQNLANSFKKAPIVAGDKLDVARLAALQSVVGLTRGGGRGRRDRSNAAVAHARNLEQVAIDNPNLADPSKPLDKKLNDLLVPTNLDAQTTQGKITESQQKLFKQEFKPTETDLLKKVLNPKDVLNAGTTASTDAGATFDKQLGLDKNGVSTRLNANLASTGQRVSQRQRTTLARDTGLARALTRASAGNNASLNRTNSNINSFQNLLDVGRGISRSATDTANAAASTQAARDAANKANKRAAAAARTQNEVSIGATLLTLATLIATA